MFIGIKVGIPNPRKTGDGSSLNTVFAGAARVPSTYTFSRTSHATHFDSSGNLSWAPSNMLTNSKMTGAVLGVIGSGGALPNNWSQTGVTGITREVVAIGEDYLDFRMYGTSGAGSVSYPHFKPGVLLTNFSLGQSYTFSATVTLLAGSFDTFSSGTGKLSIQWSNSGAYVSETGNSNVMTTTAERLFSTGVAPVSGVNQYDTKIGFIIAAGATVDVTFRIQNPQMEPTSPSSPLSYNVANGSAYYGARFDYNPATLVARGILLEEQKVNIVPNNSSSSTWLATATGLSAGATLLGRSSIRVTNNSTGAASRYIGTGSISGTMTGSAVYTQSFFVKVPAGSSLQYVQLLASSGWGDVVQAYTNFDIVNGTVGTSGTAVTASGIDNCGNGIFRIWSAMNTIASPSAGATSCILAMGSSNSDTRLPSPTFATTNYIVDVFYPQLELGPARSSVIPTTGVEETRTIETLTTLTSSWINQTRGTLYIQVVAGENDGVNFRRVACISDGTAANTIDAGRSGVGAGQWASYVSTVSSFAPTGGSQTAFANGKMVIAWDGSIKRISTNGSAVTTNATPPPTSGLTTLTVGGRIASTTNMTNGHISVIKYWPHNNFTNAQLVALTT